MSDSTASAAKVAKIRKRKLPFPYGEDPMAPNHPARGQGQALAWAIWKAKQLGITLPAKRGLGQDGYDRWYVTDDWSVPDTQDGRIVRQLNHKIVFLRETRPYWHGSWHKKSNYYADPPEVVAEFPLPSWAVPMPRVDLWHAAHQLGLDWNECYCEGKGYRVRREQAEAQIAKRVAEKMAA